MPTTVKPTSSSFAGNFPLTNKLAISLAPNFSNISNCSGLWKIIRVAVEFFQSLIFISIFPVTFPFTFALDLFMRTISWIRETLAPPPNTGLSTAMQQIAPPNLPLAPQAIVPSTPAPFLSPVSQVMPQIAPISPFSSSSISNPPPFPPSASPVTPQPIPSYVAQPSIPAMQQIATPNLPTPQAIVPSTPAPFSSSSISTPPSLPLPSMSPIISQPIIPQYAAQPPIPAMQQIAPPNSPPASQAIVPSTPALQETPQYHSPSLLSLSSSSAASLSSSPYVPRVAPSRTSSPNPANTSQPVKDPNSRSCFSTCCIVATVIAPIAYLALATYLAITFENN